MPIVATAAWRCPEIKNQKSAKGNLYWGTSSFSRGSWKKVLASPPLFLKKRLLWRVSLPSFHRRVTRRVSPLGKNNVPGSCHQAFLRGWRRLVAGGAGLPRLSFDKWKKIIASPDLNNFSRFQWDPENKEKVNRVVSRCRQTSRLWNKRYFLPWHRRPFAVNPVWQLQLKCPAVFIHFAFWWQSWLPMLHSSISKWYEEQKR